jgi:peptidoglycan/LPS O-acetylase OafA/YrhL
MEVLRLRRIDDRSSANLRFAGLDVVRAFATLGVVVLHACAPYAQHPMPGLSWSTQDQASVPVDLFLWAIELFIMPLFLVLAGFLAGRTLATRGPQALLKSRADRLVRPLLFGIVVILPLDFYVWMCGWLADGLITPGKIRSLKFDGEVDRNLWGLAHLWFLQYLVTYVLITSALSTLALRVPALRRGIPSPVPALVGLSLVAISVLCVAPEVVWGFQHAFVPVPGKWIYSGVFFVLGLAIARSDPRLEIVQNLAGRLAAPSVCCAAAALALGRWHLAGGQSGLAVSVLAVLTAVSAGSITVVLFGLAERRVRRPPRWVTYLSAASFWVYLSHHPVVALTHIDLKHCFPTMNPVWKVVIAAGTGMAVSLMTYHLLIRGTAFGRWIGVGEKAVPPITPPPPASQTQTHAPGLATQRRAA